jgi:NAD(P)H-dependent FMN reductase
MSKQRLAIVIGSIRPNRFGGHAAQWIEEIARRRTDFEVELSDFEGLPHAAVRGGGFAALCSVEK